MEICKSRPYLCWWAILNHARVIPLNMVGALTPISHSTPTRSSSVCSIESKSCIWFLDLWIFSHPRPQEVTSDRPQMWTTPIPNPQARRCCHYNHCCRSSNLEWVSDKWQSTELTNAGSFLGMCVVTYSHWCNMPSNTDHCYAQLWCFESRTVLSKLSSEALRVFVWR